MTPSQSLAEYWFTTNMPVKPVWAAYTENGDLVIWNVSKSAIRKHQAKLQVPMFIIKLVFPTVKELKR